MDAIQYHWQVISPIFRFRMRPHFDRAIEEVSEDDGPVGAFVEDGLAAVDFADMVAGGLATFGVVDSMLATIEAHLIHQNNEMLRRRGIGFSVNRMVETAIRVPVYYLAAPELSSGFGIGWGGRLLAGALILLFEGGIFVLDRSRRRRLTRMERNDNTEARRFGDLLLGVKRMRAQLADLNPGAKRMYGSFSLAHPELRAAEAERIGDIEFVRPLRGMEDMWAFAGDDYGYAVVETDSRGVDVRVGKVGSGFSGLMMPDAGERYIGGGVFRYLVDGGRLVLSQADSPEFTMHPGHVKTHTGRLPVAGSSGEDRVRRVFHELLGNAVTIE